MTKNKKGRATKAARYRTITAAPGQQHEQQNIASQFVPRAATAKTHGFSLADAARSTAEHRKGWDQQGKLRAHPVVFVSAGIVEPSKDLDQLGLNPESAIEVLQEHNSNQIPDGTVPVGEDASPRDNHQGRSQPSPSIAGKSFFIDTMGDRTLARRQGQPVITTEPYSSADETSSSEDVILFKGRKGALMAKSTLPATDNVDIQVQAIKTTVENMSLGNQDQAKTPLLGHDSPPHWRLRGHNDEDAMLADYIANMIEDDEAAEEIDAHSESPFLYAAFSNTLDLGGSESHDAIAGESGSDASNVVRNHGGEKNLEILDVGVSTTTEDTDMADEALARLLTAQDELELDDNEIVLLAGDRFHFQPSSEAKMSPNRPNETTGFQSKGATFTSGRGLVPSATDIADTFDDLDLMDWGRHNPQRKPKSKRGQPTFDVSDSELEQTLQAAWKADRLGKKERKQQRQELRAKNLLGRNVDLNDPRIKYQTGMTLDQIKEEMRSFLSGANDNISLPPMDASARKIIHELANKFNIKSKSAGQGDTRRPSLYRTKRTVRYSEKSFEQVFARAGRRYFPRLDFKGKAPRIGGGTDLGRPGRSVNHAAFTLKDGEVVGGGAPEINQTNKGHAMLEKMGWSIGMALGSQENKGILQPLASVVKRTKAGLG